MYQAIFRDVTSMLDIDKLKIEQYDRYKTMYENMSEELKEANSKLASSQVYNRELEELIRNLVTKHKTMNLAFRHIINNMRFKFYPSDARRFYGMMQFRKEDEHIEFKYDFDQDKVVWIE
jgi:hypothetical protein